MTIEFGLVRFLVADVRFAFFFMVKISNLSTVAGGHGAAYNGGR
jgi:hypothetical protein